MRSQVTQAALLVCALLPPSFGTMLLVSASSNFLLRDTCAIRPCLPLGAAARSACCVLRPFETSARLLPGVRVMAPNSRSTRKHARACSARPIYQARTDRTMDLPCKVWLLHRNVLLCESVRTCRFVRGRSSGFDPTRPVMRCPSDDTCARARSDDRMDGADKY